MPMIVKSGPAAQSQEVKHPELLACLRSWQLGHAQRDKNNEKINIPWRTLELIYIDTMTTICSIDVEDATEDSDTVGAIIEQKAEAYCRPRARGETQLVDVKCHFNDGTYTYSEMCTIDMDLKTHKAAYGHTGYNGGVGRNLASPNTQLAVSFKQSIDLHHASQGVLRETLGTIKGILNDQQKELSDRRSHEQEMFKGQIDMIKAVRDVMDWRVDEELKREFSRYKIWALHAAFEKVMKFGPPVAIKLANAVSDRLKGIDRSKPIPPHEKKAFTVLKEILQEMSKAGKVQDPGFLLEMLKGAGVEPDTVDRFTQVLQDANVAAMTEEMEESSKAGVGNIFDANGNLCIPGLSTSVAPIALPEAKAI